MKENKENDEVPLIDEKQFEISEEQDENKKQKLIKIKEKQRLIEIFDRLKKNLEDESKESIRDVHISYNEESFFDKQDLRFKPTFKCKCFYWISLIFITSIYLIGIFIIISLKKSTWNLFFSSLKCFANIMCEKEEFKKQTNFFEYFLYQLLREPMDLNLIMFWNFLGIKFSNIIGFSLSSLIFLVLNALVLILTYNISYDDYDPDTYRYSFFKIILFFFNWLFMSILFGGSSILAQQKLIDFFSLLDEFESENREILNQQQNGQYTNINSSMEFQIIFKDNNNIIDEEQDNIKETINSSSSSNQQNPNSEKKSIKEKIDEQNKKIKKRNFKILFLLGFANLLGYTGKFGIALEFDKYKNNNIINETIHNSTENLTIFLDFINNNNKTNNMSDDEIILHNHNLYENIFFYIHLIYTGCIIFSVILYLLLKLCFFKKKEIKKQEKNEKKINCCTCSCCDCCTCCCQGCCSCECCRCNCCLWSTILEISGCIIYSERRSLGEKKDEENNPACCCQLCCETIGNYFNLFNYSKKAKSCCCCKYDELEFDKDRQCFCYCYQENSLCYWINKYFVNDTQQKIIFCMILYFLGRLSTIGCQEKYEIIFRTQNIFDEINAFFTSLGIDLFLLVVYLVGIFLFKIEKNIPDKNCNDFVVLLFINFDINLFIIIFILFLDVLAGFQYSIMFLFIGFKNYSPIIDFDETFIERENLYICVFINVYFVFLINYYCLIITKNQINYEILLTQTILVSIYLSISDLIISLIRYLLTNFYNLFLFQFVITTFVGTIFSIILFRFLIFLLWKKFSVCCECCSNCKCIIYFMCVSCCAKINNYFFNKSFEESNNNLINSS